MGLSWSEGLADVSKDADADVVSMDCKLVTVIGEFEE